MLQNVKIHPLDYKNSRLNLFTYAVQRPFESSDTKELHLFCVGPSSLTLDLMKQNDFDGEHG